VKKLKIQKADILLLAAVIVMGSLFGLFLLLNRNDGTYVQVRVDGTVIANYSLEKNCTYEIQGTQESANLLVIQDGQAWIDEASCPDGLCKQMGKIDKNGQSIICLPNKVVIEIFSGQENDIQDVDFIAGQVQK
jgi:hypothetical protein